MRDVGRIIGILSNQIKRNIDRNAAARHLTGVQGRILHYILANSEHGEVFQRDIEEEFNLRRSTATGILQLLEKNGMIRRESVSYDARLKNIIPMEPAQKLQKEILTDLQNLEQLLTRDIAAEDLEVFFRVIEQMSNNLDS